MNYTGSMILFILLVQLAAYTLKWLIGFGNPLISAPLLAMQLDNTLITPGSLLPDLVINGRITWQSRNNFRWRAILPLLLAMVAGVVPGTWLLRFSLPWIIKTVLGGVVVFLGLEMATAGCAPSARTVGRSRGCGIWWPSSPVCARGCSASICFW